MEYIKNNIITIDLNVYATQTQYAADNKMRLNTVSQQVKRAKDGQPGSKGIEFIEIPELNNLILIKK